MKNMINRIWELHEKKDELFKSIEKPKIGWSSIYTPEEIIHALGMIPFRITGESQQEISNATTLLHRNICSYILSSLEEGMSETANLMDGIVVVDTCNPRKRFFDVWNHYLKQNYKYCIGFPKYDGEVYRNFFRDEIVRFTESITAHFKRELTEDALLYSIELFNKIRRQMQVLYNLRKNVHPVLTGYDMLKIVKSAMTGFKKEFSDRLADLINEIEPVQEDDSPGKHRVLICGAYFDHFNIINAIENSDVAIVCEDNSNGLKYFEGEIEVNKNPIDAISDYYFNKVTSACISDADKRLNFLTKLIKEYKIDSVIYFSLKFCDLNLIDFPYIREKLKEMNIPVLFLETERHTGNIENIKTRISSFFETKVLYSGVRR